MRWAGMISPARMSKGAAGGRWPRILLEIVLVGDEPMLAPLVAQAGQGGGASAGSSRRRLGLHGRELAEALAKKAQLLDFRLLAI
ncbi:MAG: hypothetical protein U0872_17030 [Planctomycetaceae bacterium]